MAKSKGRLANADIASLFVAAAVAVAVAHLTWLVAGIDSEFLTKLLFRPMWPGLYAAYSLMGKSAPTPTQEAYAPFVAAWINALLYAAIVLAIRLLFRQLLLSDTPTSPAKDLKDTP
jgi:hypothetical protein